MLDAAPPGGDVSKGATETPLDDAASVFLNSVQDGQFVVDMPVKSLTEVGGVLISVLDYRVCGPVIRALA